MPNKVVVSNNRTRKDEWNESKTKKKNLCLYCNGIYITNYAVFSIYIACAIGAHYKLYVLNSKWRSILTWASNTLQLSRLNSFGFFFLCALAKIESIVNDNRINGDICWFSFFKKKNEIIAQAIDCCDEIIDLWIIWFFVMNSTFARRFCESRNVLN